MFLVLQVSAKFGISPSKTFDQFSHSSFKMREFSPFNQILLSLYDVSNTFHDSIWIIYTFWNIFASMLTQILSQTVFKMSNKLIKFGKKD